MLVADHTVSNLALCFSLTREVYSGELAFSAVAICTAQVKDSLQAGLRTESHLDFSLRDWTDMSVPLKTTALLETAKQFRLSAAMQRFQKASTPVNQRHTGR